MVRSTLLATVRDERIEGWPLEVHDAVVATKRRGDFVAGTRPQPLGDGRVFVIVKLREPDQPTPRRVHPAVIAAGGAATIAVVGALGWLLITAGRWVNAHLAEVAVGGVLLLLIGLALTRRGRGCEITVIHRRHRP